MATLNLSFILYGLFCTSDMVPNAMRAGCPILNFATDTWKQAEMFRESEIIGKFGRFFIEGPLGRGARGRGPQGPCPRRFFGLRLFQISRIRHRSIMDKTDKIDKLTQVDTCF